MTLRTKILWTYLLLAIVGAVVVSLFSSWQVTNYLERRTEEDLRSRVHAFAALCEEGFLTAGSSDNHETTLRRMAHAQGLRLTLIGQTGAVVFDSEVPPDSLPSVENHLHRPEIERLRAGRNGSDRRTSATLGEEFLYAATAVRRTSGSAVDTLYVRGALRYDDVRLLERQIQGIVWGIGILTLAVIGLVSVGVSRRITRPILSIATTARAMRDGDLSQRIPVTSRDEIGVLSRAINDMAETLGNDIARMRKLELVRSEFLGNVSHELRTPIFSLQGFLETLLDGAIDDPAVNREFLEKAHRHASRLNALLGDLIEISRIESGDMKMSFRYVPVAEIVQESVDDLTPEAARKDITLAVDLSATSGEKVYADRERIHQVLFNLLDNAIKYTPAGGKIMCRTHREGEACAIDVEDTGIGIPAEHQTRIFERFYRVDRDRSRDVGGTGLGLAIVKHIVEAHGGTIRVVSQPGNGSTFSFTLRRI